MTPLPARPRDAPYSPAQSPASSKFSNAQQRPPPAVPASRNGFRETESVIPAQCCSRSATRGLLGNRWVHAARRSWFATCSQCGLSLLASSLLGDKEADR